MLASRSHFGGQDEEKFRYVGGKMATKSAKMKQHGCPSAPRSTQVAQDLCGEEGWGSLIRAKALIRLPVNLFSSGDAIARLKHALLP